MSALPSTEDLARLAKAVTPGPWRRNIENTVCNQIDGEHHAICTDQFCYAPEEQQDANAEAIALLPALIREVLDRREAEGWRDISTAPKDGTPILTYSDACVETEAQMVMWWSNDKAERCGFGWEAYDVSHMLAPSYWRPLPSNPTTEASHDE